MIISDLRIDRLNFTFIIHWRLRRGLLREFLMHARRLLTNLSDAVGFPFLSRPTGSFFLTLINALKHLLRCFHPHNKTEHCANELRVESVPITKQT